MVDLKRSDFILRQNLDHPAWTGPVVDILPMTPDAEALLERMGAFRCDGCGGYHIHASVCDEFTAICEIADLSWEIGLPPTH